MGRYAGIVAGYTRYLSELWRDGHERPGKQACPGIYPESNPGIAGMCPGKWAYTRVYMLMRKTGEFYGKKETMPISSYRRARRVRPQDQG